MRLSMETAGGVDDNKNRNKNTHFYTHATTTRKARKKVFRIWHSSVVWQRQMSSHRTRRVLTNASTANGTQQSAFGAYKQAFVLCHAVFAFVVGGWRYY